MSSTMNRGTNFSIYVLNVNSTTDTAFQITTGFTPSVGAAQVMNATSVLIKCRTAVDLQLRKVANSAEFYTIPSGTTFTLELSVANTQNLFWIRSASTTPVVEILVYTS